MVKWYRRFRIQILKHFLDASAFSLCFIASPILHTRSSNQPKNRPEKMPNGIALHTSASTIEIPHLVVDQPESKGVGQERVLEIPSAPMISVLVSRIAYAPCSHSRTVASLYAAVEPKHLHSSSDHITLLQPSFCSRLLHTECQPGHEFNYLTDGYWDSHKFRFTKAVINVQSVRTALNSIDLNRPSSICSAIASNRLMNINLVSSSLKNSTG